MLLGALHLRTSKLFSLRAKRKFYNCSPFLGQNGRKTATTTTPPAKLAPTHAPARPSRALVAAWGRCAPIPATPRLPQCHKRGPKRGVFTTCVALVRLSVNEWVSFHFLKHPLRLRWDSPSFLAPTGVIRLFVCARATSDRRIRLGEKRNIGV